MPAPGGYGLLTPFGEATYGEDWRSYRFGLAWKLDQSFDMKLTGGRDKDDSAETENTILLKGALRF